MERKVDFIIDERYHLFSRGVEKRKIFLDKKDYERFFALLYILNQENHFHVSNFLNKGQGNISDLYKQKRSNSLVAIHAYCLMPNHFHLVVQEIKEKGISKFLAKLLTSYSMYFNIKYERSGPLFVRPFRSEHIDNDRYFKHIFNYVHFNCLELYETDWKEIGIKNKKGAEGFINNYRYSSYFDFRKPKERIEPQILDLSLLSPHLSRTPLDISDIESLRDLTGLLN